MIINTFYEQGHINSFRFLFQDIETYDEIFCTSFNFGKNIIKSVDFVN